MERKQTTKLKHGLPRMLIDEVISSLNATLFEDRLIALPFEIRTVQAADSSPGSACNLDAVGSLFGSCTPETLTKMQIAKPQSQPIHQHSLSFAPGAVISADTVLKGNVVVGEGKHLFRIRFKVGSLASLQVRLRSAPILSNPRS